MLGVLLLPSLKKQRELIQRPISSLLLAFILKIKVENLHSDDSANHTIFTNLSILSSSSRL